MIMTKEEAAWVKRLQKVLNTCPSTRIGGYTVGDADITLYDRSREDEINALLDTGEVGEFGQAVGLVDAEFVILKFPFQVHSTAG